MGRKSGRAALVLSNKAGACCLSWQHREQPPFGGGASQRYAEGLSITEIQRQLGVSRPMIYKCIDKAQAAGVQQGLKETGARDIEEHASTLAAPYGLSNIGIKTTNVPLHAFLINRLETSMVAWSPCQKSMFFALNCRTRVTPQCLSGFQAEFLKISVMARFDFKS